MAQSFEKAKIQADDINLDTAGHGGTVVGTNERKLSNGTIGQNPNTLANWNKFGADYVPHRDEAFISGGQQPFHRITATDRDTEELVRDLKLNSREMLNFESAGGIPGAGIDAPDAAKNTEIFDYLLWILSQAVTAANGIFFPGRRYEFMEWAHAGNELYTPNTTGPAGDLYGLHTLPVRLLSGLTLCGSGQGATTLASSEHANQNHNLLYFVDCSSLTVCDMSVEKHANQTAGAVVRHDTVAAAVSTSVFRNLSVGNGISYGLRISGQSPTSTFTNSQFWVDGCVFDDTTGYGVWIESCFTGWIQNNSLTGANQQGIRCNTTGTLQRLSGIRILHNSLSGTNPQQAIALSRSGTYDGALHKDFTISNNELSIGSIEISGVNEWEIVENQLYAGGIEAVFPTQTGAHNLRIADNNIEGGNSWGSGIRFLGNNVTINGFEISGGRIHNVDTHAIDLQCENGAFKRGKIHDVHVLNCSREDNPSTTDYSAIRLHETAATGSHIGTTIHDNILWTTNATATSSNLQSHGIEMTNNGGGSDHCLVHDNQVAGWATAAYLLRGTNTNLNEHDNIDLGTAPIA